MPDRSRWPRCWLAAGVSARAAAGDALPEKNICADPAGPVALGSAQWNGWGRDLDNTRYQPEPAMRAADVPKLALKWAFGYQGSAVAGQPTIVDGRVFVASATGRVYSLDAKTGCTYWTFDAQTGVRTAVTIGELAAPKTAPRPKKSKHASAHRRTSRCRRPPARSSSATIAAPCMRSMRKKADCSGRRRSRGIRRPASWVRRRCTRTGCTWR